MERRHQVFVSSTFLDLRVERQEVYQALLELDCIPAGMELFPAANEDQWTLIKSVIDDCDYYIVITAGRYGSLGPSGVSYTEMEYDYAIEKGKPAIGFIYEDVSKIEAGKSELDPEQRERPHRFHGKLRKKLIRTWSTPQELGSVISRSLIKLIKIHPSAGWVRGENIPEGGAASEILRLRQELERAQREAERQRYAPPEGAADLAQGEDIFEFEFAFTAEAAKPPYSRRYRHEGSMSWSDIFATIAPSLIDESETSTMQNQINTVIAEDISTLLGIY